MEHWQIRTTEEALAYLVDCNLATVAHMASLKNRRIGEFNRQCHIAQLSVDWAKKFGVDLSKTRAADLNPHYKTIGVLEWAQQFKPKKEPTK